MAIQTDNLDPTKSEISPALPFRCRSITFNNSTGQWWECFNTPIAAYAQNVTIRIVPTQTPRIIARTPPGFTSAPKTGELGHVIYSDQDLPISSGVIVAPGTGNVGGIVTSPLASSGSTITPAIGTIGSDLIVLVVSANSGAAATVPSITTPSGFTQAIAPLINVSAGNQQILGVYTAPYSPSVITVIGTNLVPAQVTLVAIVVHGVSGVTGTASNTAGNVTNITLNPPSTPGNINLYFFTCISAVTFSAANPTSALRLADTGGNIEPIFAMQLPNGALTLTASGAGTSWCAISVGIS